MSQYFGQIIHNLLRIERTSQQRHIHSQLKATATTMR